MSRKTNRDAFARLDALYARLPNIPCQRRCAGACGPIPMTVIEADRLRRAHPQRLAPRTDDDFMCGYLTASGRCSVYAVRPLICRAWGLVKRMSCMYGCVPERWLSDHEFVQLGVAIERIGGATVVTRPGGVERVARTFSDLDTSTVSPEEADAYAEATRNLRALYGGRVVAAIPGDGRLVNIDTHSWECVHCGHANRGVASLRCEACGR